MLVLFYEKPGCATNARQKKQLRQAGCIVIERDLLNHEMDKTMLSAFFADKPVHEWFNPNAPKIKSGEVDPSNMDRQTALELLMYEPILIRRPLMVLGGRKLSGFPTEQIERIVGKPFGAEFLESCSGTETSCHEITEKEL